MIQRKSMLEILDETVKYYSEDPKRRATYNGTCSYYLDNKTCAVGRCLINPQKFQKRISKDFCGQGSIDNINTYVKTLNPFFKTEYRGHNVTFWKAIQKLHDIDENWSRRGMTMYGRKSYYEIKEMIKEGIFN